MRVGRGARALVSFCLAATGLMLLVAPLFPQADAKRIEPIIPRKKKAQRAGEKKEAEALTSRAPSRTTTPARLEPEIRDREDAAFALALPRGWEPRPLPGAAAAFADTRKPGVGMAIYLQAEPRSAPVTGTLLSFFAARKARPGACVRWRECRPVAGRPALVCEFARDGKTERALLVPRETGRRGRFFFRIEASLAQGSTTSGMMGERSGDSDSGVSDVDRMFASFRLIDETSRPARKPTTPVTPAKPTTPPADAEEAGEVESEEESPPSTATSTSVARTTPSTIPQRPVIYATTATPPTTEESAFASLLVTASDIGPGGLQRKVRNVLAAGNVERAALLTRVWPRVSELVVSSLDPAGPEARTMLEVRQREVMEVARRVTREANKRFPSRVVGLELTAGQGQPGFVEGAAGGLHRYRGTDATVSAWMVERAREVFRERATPLSWRLTAHPAPGPEWEESRLVPRAMVHETDPRSGELDPRARPLDDIIARNRWAAPRSSARTALRDAALAYRRCMAALRDASPLERTLRSARHVVAAVAAADAARSTTRAPDENAALLYFGALAGSPDLRRAMERCGPALAQLGAAPQGEDPLAVALLVQPIAERLVRQSLRHALAVRVEDVERPRQTPDMTAVMLLETAAARAGDAWDRQVARKLIALQGAVREGPEKRVLLAHGVERVTESMDVDLVEDLAWIPPGVRERLLAELPDANRVTQLLPLVRLVAREDPALDAAARWLDRRVRLVAAGPAARLASGRWGRHVPATGVTFAALAVWGRAGQVASVITTAGDPRTDARAGEALARSLLSAVVAARRDTGWLEESQGGGVLGGGAAEERDSLFASLRPAQDLAVQLEQRAGSAATTAAVDLLAGPWLDEQDPRSVFRTLRWTPQTLAADLGALSVAATTGSTAAGHDPAVEEALEGYTELDGLPGPRRAPVRERLLGVLTPAVELSRGWLQRLENATAQDLKRRDRTVARELRSGSSGLATAISLYWSIASVNRSLDQVDPRPPKVR